MSNWDDEKKALWDEDRVVKAFCRWLTATGWTTIETEKDYVDIVAERGDEKLIAEAKGKTANRPGAGVDTLYGQILRRMPREGNPDQLTRFAVVVPSNAKLAALRVPRRVRAALRIDVYTVSDDDEVSLAED